jgi:hypothetical protein
MLPISLTGRYGKILENASLVVYQTDRERRKVSLTRPVTCAITQSNEYRAEWAKAAWPSPTSISTLLCRKSRREPTRAR